MAYHKRRIELENAAVSSVFTSGMDKPDVPRNPPPNSDPMQAMADHLQRQDMLKKGSTRSGLDFWLNPDA